MPIDSGLVAQRALLILTVAGSKTGRFKRCFEAIEPISVIVRQGREGTLDRYVVGNALNAQPKIMSSGCRFHMRALTALSAFSPWQGDLEATRGEDNG